MSDIDDEIDTVTEPKHGFLSRMARRLILLATIVVIFIIASTIYLTPTSTLNKADAIIAISGGDTYARTMKAVDLYHAGWAPKLVFSGAALDPRSPSNAEVMKQIAQANGVPNSAIETDKSSINTAQNAKNSHNLLLENNYKTIILVTSEYHQRRASLQFAKIFGPKVQIINQPAKDFYWNKYTWWTNPQGWYLTLTELAKIPIVMVRGY